MKKNKLEFKKPVKGAKVEFDGKDLIFHPSCEPVFYGKEDWLTRDEAAHIPQQTKAIKQMNEETIEQLIKHVRDSVKTLSKVSDLESDPNNTLGFLLDDDDEQLIRDMERTLNNLPLKYFTL